MLAKRLMTAAILIPLVVYLILWAPSDVFIAAGLGLFSLALWEWSAFFKFSSKCHRYIVFSVGMVFFLYFATLYSSFHTLLSAHLEYELILQSGLFALAAFFCGAIVFGSLAVLGFFLHPEFNAIWKHRAFLGFLPLFWLLPLWAICLNMHTLGGPIFGEKVVFTLGRYELLSFLMVIWATDTGAYFAGRRWGKHLLLPKISPKKSWEGFAGGVALALVAVVLINKNAFGFAQPVQLAWSTVAILVVLSVYGDLFESMLKRAVDIKDSGSILPGHGGVLDRLDSALFSIPVVALVSLLDKLRITWFAIAS